MRTEGARIAAMAAAVPRGVLNNMDPSRWGGDPVEAAAWVASSGIRSRRAAAPGQCASDLCEAAAVRLLGAAGVDRGSVDAMMFVSQTPDYRMPATSVLLQHRLGLPSSCAAFDVSLGCSGFVYGLGVAFSLVSGGGLRRVLLLNGETRTRAYGPRDPDTARLFGDAGCATLIERAEAPARAVFLLGSDGSKAGLIGTPAGGYRQPSTVETVVERLQADGGVRSEEHGTMNHRGVLRFIVERVPGVVRDVLCESGITSAEVDYFLLHQANRLANRGLEKRLGIPAAKAPSCVEDFGNTSGASIPLTMVTRLASELAARELCLVLCGFGVGMSWGAAVLGTHNVAMVPLIET